MPDVAQELNEAESGQSEEQTVASALINHLVSLGVERAFGVIGGAIGVLFDGLEESSIKVSHFRHEGGAAFAAAEAYFATGAPTLVFSTTGPGFYNVLTGMTAAKWDGAKVVLISGATGAAQRGRWATQESSPYTASQDGFYTRGPLFDFALRLEHAAEVPEVMRRLSLGLSRCSGFVAHISLPIGLQASRVELPPMRVRAALARPAVAAGDVEQCARLLKQDDFAIWLGFGARGAATAVRALVERTGARVFCSPRAKGIVSESHPLFVGVTGLGGHDSVIDYMLMHQPRRILVLGTRLGEATSFWDPDLVPEEGFIHVDLDPEVPGAAYPDVPTVGVQADIGRFVEALLPHFPEQSAPKPLNLPATRAHAPLPLPIAGRGPVRPQVLMQALQRHVVQGSDAIILSECGNAFAWCNHYLSFSSPGRYRVSTLFSSMGHCAAGVVGAALASGKRAVAVVGDGSMLMSSEVSTAVQYGAQAVWIVLNDAAYSTSRSGQQMLGLASDELSLPAVDFVAFATALGAQGVRVETEDALEDAFHQAAAASAPFVIDVVTDPNEVSPLMPRFESLLEQGDPELDPSHRE